MIRAGALRHKVRIEYPVKATDGAGGSLPIVWTVLDSVYAEVLPATPGTEPAEADQPRSNVRHRVRTRFRTGVTNAMRIVFANRVLHIQSVVNVEDRNEELEIFCVEKVGEGVS